ncbi:MAG TPA: glycosyltransferase [Prosthecobacter sp.]
MKTVHLVVPCYRESGRIGVFLPELCTAMDRLGGVRVLVVEDGSGAEEQTRMKELISGWRQTHASLDAPLLLPENAGKGGAVYAGWAKAGGADLLAFVDADGACPAREVVRMITMARSGDHEGRALFASRVKMLGRRVERLLKRHLLGRVYATLVSELLGIPVYDSQCGLKLLPRADYERVAGGLGVHGFAFDVELMVALLDAGVPVEEVPIDWHEIPGGKVRLLRDSLHMARDVWDIRKRRGGKRC